MITGLSPLTGKFSKDAKKGFRGTRSKFKTLDVKGKKFKKPVKDDIFGVQSVFHEEVLNTVSERRGAINVYFNKSALTQYASPGNETNYHVNLERRLINRINQAKKTIDMAAYEISLVRIVDALIRRAADGVVVRVVVDAKEQRKVSGEYTMRYTLMRLCLERLRRGKDRKLGTSDDVHLIADSPVFAVEDIALRRRFMLPPLLEGMRYVTIRIGKRFLQGFLLIDGELKEVPDDLHRTYYSPGAQMHNKFVIIDDTWLWTGSWNFTVTGLYGSYENQKRNILGGNTQHCIEIHSPQLAHVYKQEFNQMWGGETARCAPRLANFQARKRKGNAPHTVFVNGDVKVQVMFSPGYQAVSQLSTLVSENADLKLYFSIFAWSDQTLCNTLKKKWEGTEADMKGTRTHFDIKGLFDGQAYNAWWSASVDMRGQASKKISQNNPNIRWATPAPVFRSREARKLHSKTMIIDADTASDPTVVVGSMNWSATAEKSNDENTLIIHDAKIVNQFVQEFYARYQAAGGKIPPK